LLQHFFLVVMVHVSGCHGTRFWYLWYLFLAVTVLVSGFYTIFILVVAVLVSGCSVCYGPRVPFCYAGTCLFLVVMVFVLGCFDTRFLHSSFLFVTVFIYGCYVTPFSLLWHSFMILTVFISGCFSTTGS
jgi:hypothetical protein